MNNTDFRYTAVSEAINACKPQPRFQNKLAIGVMALGFALSINTASAANIWVNTLTPDIDATDGKCSLIEAIENANADSKMHPNCQKGKGADTIHLWRNKSYTLDKVHNSRNSGADSLVNGLPVITSKITINGKGATIERKASYTSYIESFRLFEVAATGDLTLTNVSLKYAGPRTGATGGTPYLVEYIGPGGAIDNAGSVVLDNVHVERCAAGSNAHEGAINNTGMMQIKNSSFYRIGLTGGLSAGIANFGEMTITASSIDGGRSGFIHREAIYNHAGGNIEVSNSTVTGSMDAIVNNGNMKLEHSTVAGNYAFTALYEYDVIRNKANLILNNNLISGNAIQNRYDPGAYYPSYYDGFNNEHVILRNSGSIISSNNIFGHDKVAFSSADLSIGPSFASGFTPDASDLLLTSDSASPAPITKILTTEAAHRFDEFTIDGVLPLFTDNGGSTPTIALVPGSIAIDAASNADCPATDQRGIVRPQGNACDIGAFEYEQTVSAGTGEMGDYVWEDLNKNGVQDSNEPGMSNVTVELQTCAGNVVDTVTTNSAGQFRFTQIPVGDYQMQYKLPASHQFSPVNQGGNYRYDSNANQATGLTPCLSMKDGQSRLAVDAGMIPNGSAIGTGIMGDYVWNDLNADGIQDSNEPGLSNVSIDLLSCSGDLMDTTYSDANGNFRFTGIAPGDYQMRYNLLANYRYSPEKQGSNYRDDSNVNTTTGLTPCLSIADGQQRLAVDGGMVMEVLTGEPELAVTINDASSVKPGPVVSTGETLNWRYTISNPTGSELTNVVVRGRQKLPTLGSWETLCTIGTIASTEEGSCTTSSTAETGTYKMLVTINGLDAQGNPIQLSEQAFYQGK